MRSIEERFETKVDRTGTHHRWLGTYDDDGTLQIRVNGALTTARRVAWELAHGPLPAKITVAACETDPSCVRVEHLGQGRRRRRPPPPPPRPTANRTGTLREIGAGVWELAITSADGSGRRYRRVRGDRDDATAALASLAVEHGAPAATLDALIGGYLAHLQTAGRSPNTLRRYHQLWRQWLAPNLGPLDPASLTSTKLQRSLRHMADADQSPSSIHQAAIILTGTLSWAHHNQHLPHNPALNLRLPNRTRIGPPRHR
jgi:HNH endonuclease